MSALTLIPASNRALGATEARVHFRQTGDVSRSAANRVLFIRKSFIMSQSHQSAPIHERCHVRLMRSARFATQLTVAPLVLVCAAWFASNANAQCPFQPAALASAQATRDGVLFLRNRLGVSAGELTVGLGTTRDSSDISTEIAANNAKLDINGSGTFDINDAAIIARFLAGFRGDGLIPGGAGAGSTRPTATDIQRFIDDGCPPPTPPTSVEREIVPSVTSDLITGSASPHIAINPSATVPAKGKLFVMLPGTTAVPRTYRYVVRTGPPRGYHAIGLNYPNSDTIVSQCMGSADLECNGKARREVLTGADVSTVVNVDVPNSIIGRLVALLNYLDTTYPSEGWGQFLLNGQPRWELITVAGHSQGAGNAGYLAKLVSLDRVVMFSSPGDPGASPGAAVQWASLPNVTPASRQYGFTHVNDTQASYARVTANWTAIGLGAFGAILSVDGTSAPFNGSHQLSTSAAPNQNPSGPSAAPTHGAPVVDAVTPLDAQGEPLFRPVWIYLAFP
jgi:hypothetical protein